MFGSRSRVILLVAASLLFAAGGMASAQEVITIDKEAELKGAWLCQFANLFCSPGEREWLKIGILGKNPFEGHLKDGYYRPSKLKPFRVRTYASMDDYEPCHALFISRQAADGRGGETTEDRLKAAKAKLEDSRVLIVADTPDFAEKGAMVNLGIENNLIKIEVNVDRAKAAGFPFTPGRLQILEDLRTRKKMLTYVP
jgi:hypothetical protein